MSGASNETVSIGVFAYNEEATIDACLRSILAQHTTATIVDVAVVSSASSDGTDAIVARLAARDPRLRALPQTRRRGKTHAINHFLAHAREASRVVIVSGDVVLGDDALERLLAPFEDPTVGMTGGRPCPQNDRAGVGRFVHLLWDLHDAVARNTPKLGEVVALRAPVPRLPEWTCADEASLEADVIHRRGLRLRYCPDALLHNRGPETLADWLDHRRRIARAHSEIQHAGYRPATRDPVALARGIAAHAFAHPEDLGLLGAAALLEAWAWIAGSFDATTIAPHERHWSPIESAKRPVHAESPPPP